VPQCPIAGDSTACMITSLRLAIMICVTLVNTQTDIHKQLLISYTIAQPEDTIGPYRTYYINAW